MFSLQLRLYLLLGLFFAIVYFVIFIIGNMVGFGNNIFYLVFAFGFVIVQYLIGPFIVEWSMKIRYITENDDPNFTIWLKSWQEANIPMPGRY